jgi:bifunctional non-homologous end joining protein LigD
MLSSSRPLRPAGFIEPCLPMGAPRPPLGATWLHEMKHDGFRLMAQRRRGMRDRLLTRNGNDFSERYPTVAAALAALQGRSCLIDGEVTVRDSRGLAIFDLLRHGNWIKPDAVLFAFDLIELDGEDLRSQPIEERKRRLKTLLRRGVPGIQFSEHMQGDGAEIFAHACKLGCEGIVSKRLGSRYVSGRWQDDKPSLSERAIRKRRLIKGPREFREMRSPKAKRASDAGTPAVTNSTVRRD